MAVVKGAELCERGRWNRRARALSFDRFVERDVGVSMPAEVIWEERGVRRHYSGVVTATEFLQSIFTVQSDPRFDSLAYSILDALDVTGTDVSDFDIKAVAAHSIGAQNSNSTVKVALVVTDPTILAMAQIFLSPPYSSYPAEILSTREEARAWISAACA